MGRDEQIGVDIIRKATEEPLRQISGNARYLGAIVIEKVLQQNKLIIPVLIEGACMPAAEGLPQEIMGLVERNALVLHDARFAFDTRKLIDELAKKIAPCQQEGSSGKPLRPQRWEVRRYPLGRFLTSGWWQVVGFVSTMMLAITFVARHSRLPSKDLATGPSTTDLRNPHCSLRHLVYLCDLNNGYCHCVNWRRSRTWIHGASGIVRSW